MDPLLQFPFSGPVNIRCAVLAGKCDHGIWVVAGRRECVWQPHGQASVDRPGLDESRKPFSNAAEPAPESAAIAITHLTSPGQWDDAIRVSDVKQPGGLAVCLHLAFAVSWEMPLPAACKLLACAAVQPLGSALWQIPVETREPTRGEGQSRRPRSVGPNIITPHYTA